MGARVISVLPGSGGFKGADFTNEMVKSYTVEVDLTTAMQLPDDHILQALTATGLPRYLDSYSADLPACRCIDDNATYIEESGNKFRVDVSFSSAPIFDGNSGAAVGDTSEGTDGQLGQDAPESPSQQSSSTELDERPWTIETFDRQIEQAVGEKDVNGVKIVNKAGQPITGLTQPVTIPGVRFIGYTTKTLGVHLAKKQEYTNTTNGDKWFIWNPGTLRCTKYDCQPAWKNGTYYTKVTLEFEICEAGWSPTPVLNCGTICMIGGGKLGPCVDTTGNPVSEPVPLNSAGYQLEEGADPIYLDFDLYESTYFSSIV